MRDGMTVAENRGSPPIFSIGQLPFGKDVQISTWTASSTETARTTIVERSRDVTIAIMGATGSGKTTFINLASGSQLRVGSGLKSCTDFVQEAKAFELDGRQVTLIDTPGFDDTTKSDRDILNIIAEFLATQYQNGKKLSGVIYMHRISDFRMSGISTRNFKMFRQLCGDSSLKNVVIVTNMWAQVSKEVGEAREAELKREGMFFKSALDKGAGILRHDNTKNSAQHVIRRIMNNHPLPLRIQRELVNEMMDISQTGAGEEIDGDLKLQTRKHRQEMRELQEEIQEALRVKDEVVKRQLEGTAQRLQEEMTRLEAEAQELTAEHSEEQKRIERQMQEQIEGAFRAAERARDEHGRRISELQRWSEQTMSESQRTRDDLLRQMEELRAADRPSGCICI